MVTNFCLTDIQLTTNNSKNDQEKILICSVNGVDLDDISIRFNDKDGEHWCDHHPPPEIKLINHTTCQLTIHTNNGSKMGDYNCTVSLHVQNGDKTVPCDLHSHTLTILMNEADLCKWPIIETAIITASAASVVTAIIVIIIVLIVCKCCKKCRQKNNEYSPIQGTNRVK